MLLFDRKLPWMFIQWSVFRKGLDCLNLKTVNAVKRHCFPKSKLPHFEHPCTIVLNNVSFNGIFKFLSIQCSFQPLVYFTEEWVLRSIRKISCAAANYDFWVLKDVWKFIVGQHKSRIPSKKLYLCISFQAVFFLLYMHSFEKYFN